MKKTITILLAVAMVATLFCGVAAADKFDMGVQDGNTYWNETFSIGCTLDENWYFLSMEEIYGIKDITKEQLEGEMAEMLEQGSTAIVAYAQNMENGATMNITMERLSITNAVLVTEKSYIELSVDGLKEALSQMGLENIKTEIVEEEFCGEKHAAMNIYGTINGMDFFEKMIAVKDGRNVSIVTIGSVNEDHTADILDCFTAEKP